jgi:hypothetical protein
VADSSCTPTGSRGARRGRGTISKTSKAYSTAQRRCLFQAQAETAYQESESKEGEEEMKPTDCATEDVPVAPKPCPFCGAEPSTDMEANGHRKIACRNAAGCQVLPSTPWYRDNEFAMYVWNKRK